MKIGIICASDDELAPFLAMIDSYKVTERVKSETENMVIPFLP